MSDLTTADFAALISKLTPTGEAWPTEPDSVQQQAFAALAGTFRRLNDRANALGVDMFPATTVELLPEWEASLGLPDPCTGPLPTIAQRQAAVVAKLVARGGQSVPYFISVAAARGVRLMTQNYARAVDGLVVETFQTDDDITALFPSGYFQPCPSDVAQGWALSNVNYAAPPAVALAVPQTVSKVQPVLALHAVPGAEDGKTLLDDVNAAVAAAADPRVALAWNNATEIDRNGTFILSVAKSAPLNMTDEQLDALFAAAAPRTAASPTAARCRVASPSPSPPRPSSVE